MSVMISATFSSEQYQVCFPEKTFVALGKRGSHSICLAKKGLHWSDLRENYKEEVN